MGKETLANFQKNINLIKNIQSEKDMYYYDKIPYDSRSNRSHQQLYNHYKHIDKVMQQNQINRSLRPSPYSHIISGVDKATLPQKLGLLGPRKKNQLKIKYFSLFRQKKYGDKYMSALSSAINSLHEIEEVNVNDNRITEIGISGLMS